MTAQTRTQKALLTSGKIHAVAVDLVKLAAENRPDVRAFKLQKLVDKLNAAGGELNAQAASDAASDAASRNEFLALAAFSLEMAQEITATIAEALKALDPAKLEKSMEGINSAAESLIDSAYSRVMKQEVAPILRDVQRANAAALRALLRPQTAMGEVIGLIEKGIKRET